MANPRLENQTTDSSSPDLHRASLSRTSRLASQRSNAKGEPSQRTDRRAKASESHEDLSAPGRTRNAKRNSPPDGTASLGRGSYGRQFTVANIGNNGRIYLRPVVRPGNQRSQPTPSHAPFAIPPNTPPRTTGPDANTQARPSSTNPRDTWFSSSLTPPKSQRRPERRPSKSKEKEVESPLPSPVKRGPRKRSHSFSTVGEHTSRPTTDQQGTFKVVIHRPASSRNTDTDVQNVQLPVLQVPIPHYRLGTPQFAAEGRAILRSSLYTRSGSTREEVRSSNASNAGYDKLLRTQTLRSSLASRRHSEAFPRPLFHRRSTVEMVSSRSSLPAQSEARQSIVAVAPRIYDALTLNPDDPTVVRYAPNSDEIVAATPSRLVAHITSPSFLDYELLSDFFLTFRAFVQPDELVSFLVTRLRWAVDRPDDSGRIVRVRTFVALRHWILNYFSDDFVPDYELRKHFCELVNGVYEYLQNRSHGAMGDIKIIGELKKCWRRTCALHWESADPFARESPEDDILPGGRSGSNVSDQSSLQPAMTPMAQMQPKETKPFAGAVSYSTKSSEGKSFGIQKMSQHAPQPSTVSAPFSIQYSARPGTDRTVPLSPTSPESATFLSCSIPLRPIYRFDGGGETPLVPHTGPTPALRITPSPTNARNPHPLQSHNNRSESLLDVTKFGRKPPSLPDNDSEFQIPGIYVIPGSLVRGVLYQPGSPYFDVNPAGSVRVAKPKPQLTVEFVEPTGPNSPRVPQNGGPGVKKFLGSMRRALSNKPGSSSSDQFPQPGDAPHLRSTASIPDIVPERPLPRKSSQRSRPQVRIDLLHAMVVESFKGAVEAGMEEDRAMERDILAFTKQVQYDENGTPQSGRHLTRFDRSVTIGSRSIVIVDDTQPDLPMPPMMSGALHPPSSPPSHTTVSMYEGYVADATQSFLQERDERFNSRVGKVPTRTISNAKDTSVSPTAYEPTGLRKPSLRGKGKQVSVEAPSPRKRFTMTSTVSGGSTLRRYASYHSGESRSKSKGDRDIEMQAAQETQIKPSDSDEFILGRPPGRQLRRRPGGDLKAVNKVHDLEESHRPNSAGSVSSLSPSYRDSFDPSCAFPSAIQSQDMKMRTPIIPSLPSSTPKKKRDEASQIASPSTPKRRSISLIQTHSSQPNLRPSFEAEVAKLAALPDDEEDDGGIEAALLKLEGKYEKKTPQPSPVADSFVASPTKSAHTAHTAESDWLPSEHENDRRLWHQNQHVEEVHPVAALSPENVQTTSIHHFSSSSAGVGPSRFASRPPGPSVAESEDSYSSVPLLERGLSGTPTRQRMERMHIRESSSEPSIKEAAEAQHSVNSSIEHVVETDSMRRIPKGDTLPIPRSPTMHESFLLDDTQELSENYGIYMQSDTDSQGVRSFFDDEAVEDEPNTSTFSHPLRHPDTPPIPRKLVTPPQNTTFNQGLPTPSVTPTTKYPMQPQVTAPMSPVSPVKGNLKNAGEPSHSKPSRVTHSSVHLPFILGYDAEVVAQQFTIIEKDALDEIDWKELIELRWKQTSPAVHDWVEYLRTQDPRGVDLVIARFNLVVKWIVSEVVLTENPDERVRTIVQYIHIAALCRRYRNYATMYQITIALLSADCSRLKRTWENVPTNDQLTFSDLEKLVQPLKNFHNLRAEMETGTGDEGCIPFIGIYTRDLVYNAQKPPYITSPPQNPNEPLVNFERHHTAATIVKSLLRLLEASSKYQFEVVPQAIDKCLWLAALDDVEITQRSKTLE